ncbi:membrane protein YpdK [Dryocola sp. BD626]|jgi:hypothetical protein|uniref:membrane protein YpdK n=1 Tax=Dryocola sp. BD626 TaxID=3133273 RepID=UPI003F50B03E
MQREAAFFGIKLIPKCPNDGFAFLYLVIWHVERDETRGASEVKYFLMGISVILVVWVGTFMALV